MTSGNSSVSSNSGAYKRMAVSADTAALSLPTTPTSPKTIAVSSLPKLPISLISYIFSFFGWNDQRPLRELCRNFNHQRLEQYETLNYNKIADMEDEADLNYALSDREQLASLTQKLQLIARKYLVRNADCRKTEWPLFNCLNNRELYTFAVYGKPDEPENFQLPNLRFLEIHSFNAFDQDIAHWSRFFSACSTITALTMADFECARQGDLVQSVLGYFPNLLSLGWHAPSIFSLHTGATLTNFLSKNPPNRLTTLIIGNCNLPEALLAPMPSVNILDLYNCAGFGCGSHKTPSSLFRNYFPNVQKASLSANSHTLQTSLPLFTSTLSVLQIHNFKIDGNFLTSLKEGAPGLTQLQFGVGYDYLNTITSPIALPIPHPNLTRISFYNAQSADIVFTQQPCATSSSSLSSSSSSAHPITTYLTRCQNVTFVVVPSTVSTTTPAIPQIMARPVAKSNTSGQQIDFALTPEHIHLDLRKQIMAEIDRDIALLRLAWLTT